MLCLEYAYFGKDYVRTIVPIATSATHSAWGISWGEAQRQSIYSDPKYEDGYYSVDDPPLSGLGAARMAALLTYRSRDSFEARFGRNTPDASKRASINKENGSPKVPNEHWSIHNDGHRLGKGSRPASRNGTVPDQTVEAQRELPEAVYTDPQFHGATEFSVPVPIITRQNTSLQITTSPRSHIFDTKAQNSLGGSTPIATLLSLGSSILMMLLVVELQMLQRHWPRLNNQLWCWVLRATGFSQLPSRKRLLGVYHWADWRRLIVRKVMTHSYYSSNRSTSICWTSSRTLDGDYEQARNWRNREWG